MSYIELTEHHGLAYMAYSNSGGYEAFQRVKVFGKYLSPNSYFSGRYLQGIGCELVCPPPPPPPGYPPISQDGSITPLYILLWPDG